MNFKKLTGFVFAVACALSLAAPAAAQWNAKQRTDFVNDCLNACRKNPRVPEAQRPQCDDYCLCIVTEGQKLFNETQFEQINNDFIAKKQTPEIKQFTDLTPICNRKAFAPR